MTDVIHLNSIKSTNCNCNKDTKMPCALVPTSVPDIYFKIKNFFNELKNEWQKEEARKNLGITELVKFELTKKSKEPGGVNEWQIVLKKGNDVKIYTFSLTNGDRGESAKIRVGKVITTEEPIVWNTGTETDAILNFGIPSGEKGDRGSSAYEIALENGFVGSIDQWLESLHGKDGTDGKDGIDGLPGLNGTNGKDGKDGTTPVIEIGSNGNWFINNKDTGKPSRGPQGEKGESGASSDFFSYPIFLYKKLSFTTEPSNQMLQDTLWSLKNEVENREKEFLVEKRGWSETIPTITTLGKEFIYMAIALNTNGDLSSWQIVQLTGIKGLDGQDCDCTSTDDPENPLDSLDYSIESLILIRPNWEEREFKPEVTYLIKIKNNNNFPIDMFIPGNVLSRKLRFSYVNTAIGETITNVTIPDLRVKNIPANKSLEEYPNVLIEVMSDGTISTGSIFGCNIQIATSSAVKYQESQEILDEADINIEDITGYFSYPFTSSVNYDNEDSLAFSYNSDYIVITKSQVTLNSQVDTSASINTAVRNFYNINNN